MDNYRTNPKNRFFLINIINWSSFSLVIPNVPLSIPPLLPHLYLLVQEEVHPPDRCCWRSDYCLVISFYLLCNSVSPTISQLWCPHRWVLISLQQVIILATLPGIGVAMTRDAATLMVGQYFKRRRELVEIFLVSSSGLGVSLMGELLQNSLR